jgi:hypothetical protein
MVRVELPCPQKGHAVLITFATSPPDRPGQVAHLLDLYAIFQTDALLSERELQAEIRAAHANLNAAFEGSVTDKLRAIFEPISQLC